MERFDTDRNGNLSDAEKNAVTEIDVSDQPISSMVGVENFKNLEKMYCCYMPLSSLDVSQNTALKYLNCGDTQLSSLDVSKNTVLESLSCYSTPLSSLDVSKNTALTGMYCGHNQFSNGTPFFDTAELKGFDLSRASG